MQMNETELLEMLNTIRTIVLVAAPVMVGGICILGGLVVLVMPVAVVGALARLGLGKMGKKDPQS
jgi:hypothetical protein